MMDDGDEDFSEYNESYRFDLKRTFQVSLLGGDDVDGLPSAQGPPLFRILVSPLRPRRLSTNGQIDCSVSPTYGEYSISFSVYGVDVSS